MVRTLGVLFLVAHGLVHSAVWASRPAQTAAAPFDPARSWALDAVHATHKQERDISVLLAWLAGAAFLLAALMLAIATPAWQAMAIIAASLGLLLKLAYFNPWLTLGVALDVAVVLAVADGWPNSLY